MNNEEYYKELAKIEDSLNKLRSEGEELACRIIVGDYTAADLYFYSSLDRCLRLIDGIIILLKERNLTCVGPLLRLQMDNCMRTYAVYIAKDRDKVVSCILDGSKISDQRDTTGNKMYDSYLKTAISKFDSNFADVYDKVSGFIHLSDKAFFQALGDVNAEGMMFLIGHELPEKRNEPLMECAEAFCRYVRLHYELLAPVANSKTQLD